MKNSLLKSVALASVLSVAVSHPALANEDEKGPFIGAGVGMVKIHDYCASGGGVTVTDCEDSEPFLHVFGGYHFNNVFAGEVGVGYATGFEATANNISADSEYITFTAGLRGRFAVNEKLSIIARAGMHFWEHEVSVPGASFSLSVDGTDPYYGIQLEHMFEDSAARKAFIGLNVSRYEGDGNDADVFGIHLRGQF